MTRWATKQQEQQMLVLIELFGAAKRKVHIFRVVMECDAIAPPWFFESLAAARDSVIPMFPRKKIHAIHHETSQLQATGNTLTQEQGFESIILQFPLPPPKVHPLYQVTACA